MRDGSGQTTRALAALPDGAIYVVPFARMVDYCRRLLAEAGRDPGCIRLMTLEQARYGLLGWPRSIVLDIDRACYDFMTAEQRDLMRVYRARFALPPVPGREP